MNRREMLFTLGAGVIVQITEPQLTDPIFVNRTAKQMSAESYCFKQAPQLRRHRREAQWMVYKSVEFLPEKPPVGTTKEEWEGKLRKHLTTEIKSNYKSAILIWILLYVVLPIIVRLMINWWFSQAETVQ